MIKVVHQPRLDLTDGGLILDAGWFVTNQVLLVGELNDGDHLLSILFPSLEILFDLIHLSFKRLDIGVALLDHSNDGIKLGFLARSQIKEVLLQHGPLIIRDVRQVLKEPDVLDGFRDLNQGQFVSHGQNGGGEP